MNSNCPAWTDKRYAWKIEFVLIFPDGRCEAIFVTESSAIRAVAHAHNDIILPRYGTGTEIVKVERVGEISE